MWVALVFVWRRGGGLFFGEERRLMSLSVCLFVVVFLFVCLEGKVFTGCFFYRSDIFVITGLGVWVKHEEILT